MHLVDTPVTRVLDGLSMILIASYLVLLTLQKNSLFMSIFYFGLNIVGVIFLFTSPIVSLIIFIALVIYLTYRLSKIEGARTYFRKATLMFIVGFIFWLLDASRIYCFPTHYWITGHSVWHLLTGLGLYYIYKLIDRIAATKNEA
jgi:hypothetical protein